MLMATKRQLETRFWKDTYIKSLKSNEKYLFVYILTNSFTNIAWVYEIWIDEIMLDTKMLERQIRDIFKKFEEDGKIIYKKNWLFIRNFIKYQSKNPSIILWMQKELDMIPKWFKHELNIQLPEFKDTSYAKKKKRSVSKYVVDDRPKPIVDKARAKENILKFKKWK